MSSTYTLSVTLHILLACFWLGGMMFLVFIYMPAARTHLDETGRMALLQAMGESFRRSAWIGFALLLLTGLYQMSVRGIGVAALFDLGIGGWTGWLRVKLAVFTAVLLLSAWHDFGVGPAATRAWRAESASAETSMLRRRASWMGRLNFALGLALFYLAVRLVRG